MFKKLATYMVGMLWLYGYNTHALTTLEKSNRLFDFVEISYPQFFSPRSNTQQLEIEANIAYFRGYESTQTMLATYMDSILYFIQDQWYVFGSLDDANKQLCNSQCFSVQTGLPERFIHIIEINNTNSPLGAIMYDQDNNMFTYYGSKSKQGTLLSVDRVEFHHSASKQSMFMDLNIDHLPRKIGFSTGEYVEFNYDTENRRLHAQAYEANSSKVGEFDINLDSQEGGKTLVDAQSFMNLNPPSVTLCRKRAKTIQMNHIPDSFITKTGEILERASDIISFRDFFKSPTAKNLLMFVMDATRSVLSSALPESNSATKYLHTVEDIGDTALSCMGSQAACALKIAQEVGIPLLRKLNQGQIEVGELNECSASEKISSYLYADCANREVTKDGDKLCRIKYGSTLDMVIIYYNPYPYSGVITFAADGVRGALPAEFKINVGAQTGGTFETQLKHQILVDPTQVNCHTTESDPVIDPTAPDPGSIWGLSLEAQNKIINSEHFPEELLIVTEGNGKGGIAGVPIPCWYKLEAKNGAATSPKAVSGIYSTSVSDKGVTLRWTDNSSNEDGFYIFRFENGDWRHLTTVSANTTSYTDVNVDPAAASSSSSVSTTRGTAFVRGRTYTYNIVAYNNSGKSESQNYEVTIPR